ncbi:MAG: hypothetical protein RL095_2236 [Verrucomicrobiota bacterium]|jgi:thiol-disulfide isomerase/thioredoxin
MKLFLPALLASLFLLSAEADAATYQGIDPASRIRGDQIKPEDLADKVVFFEYWGINCPPCRESMPHLQKLYKDFGRDGRFIVIGAHSQNRSDAEINQFLDSQKVSFPIYQGASVVEAPCTPMLPFAALFDHKGQLVKSGLPWELYALVPKLVEDCPVPTAQAEIEAEVKRQLALITPETSAAKLNLPWPLKFDPALTQEKIRASLRAEAEIEAAKAFPPADREALTREAREKFRLRRVGENVDIVLRGGQGSNARATGEFKGIDRLGRIQIGVQRLATSDFDEAALATFDPVTHEKCVADAVKKGMELRQREKLNRIEELESERLPAALSAAGYVKSGRNWVSQPALVEAQHKRDLAAALPGIRAAATQLVTKQQAAARAAKAKAEADLAAAAAAKAKADAEALSLAALKAKVPVYDPDF